MKQAILALVAAGALAGLPGAAPADAQVSAASVYEAGRCIVRADRRAAVALMGSLPLDSSVADLSSLRESGARGCASAAAGVPSMLIRGAIAQELFIRDFRSFSREPSNPERLVNLNLPVEAYATPRSDSAGDLYRWSDCVVRNDTVNTERLLHSPIGSPEEAAAIAGLRTYMSACFASGARIDVRASQVRSLFAQSAYYSMYRYWTGQLRNARAGDDD